MLQPDIFSSFIFFYFHLQLAQVHREKGERTESILPFSLFSVGRLVPTKELVHVQEDSYPDLSDMPPPTAYLPYSFLLPTQFYPLPITAHVPVGPKKFTDILGALHMQPFYNSEPII